MKRALSLIIWLSLMAGFGVAVNLWFLGHKHTAASLHPTVRPTATQSEFTLPGTIYVAAEGRIYALRGSAFTDIGLPQETGRWMQPAALADGTLLVVLRNSQSSDLYHVTATGAIIDKLTNNDVHSIAVGKIRDNHWVFWPHVAADGATVFYGTDNPKAPNPNGYEVDFTVWSGRVGGTVAGRQWTTPDYYTGGDTVPVPLRSGGLIYVAYAIAADGKVEATVLYQKAAQSTPIPLTLPADDCFSIALSPDEQTLAMACSGATQKVNLRVAHLDAATHTLGAATTIVSGCLCNSPSWAPNSRDLLYLAPLPSDPNGDFELWYVAGAVQPAAPSAAAATAPAAPSAAPAAPSGTVPQPQIRQITSQLDLDATSAPLWVS